MSGMTLLERDENRSIYQLPEPIDSMHSKRGRRTCHYTLLLRIGMEQSSIGGKAAAPYDSSEQIHLESKKTEVS